MTAAKTYLKIKFGDRTIRSLPAEERHSIALVMSRGLPSVAKKLGVMLDIIKSLIGDEEYERIIEDVALGRVETADVVNLLGEISKATEKHRAAHRDADVEAEG